MSDTPKPRNKEIESNISKLRAKLRELFQLDRGDLDFGLYRIMALKSAEVDDFLEKHLLPQVTDTLGDISNSDLSNLQAELDALTKILTQAGVKDIGSTDRIKELNALIKAAKRDQQTEADTYNHLCNFFSRYYDEGDFMSLRRYKSEGREAYSIPYNGEEVKLHWANSDQYYIKTTENYASYVFIVDKSKQERRVRFQIAEADNEKDNIKEANTKKRLFILAKDFIAEEKTTLIIRFDHRPLTEGEKTKYPQNGSRQQATINHDTEQRILKNLKGDWLNLIFTPCPTEADDTRTLLGKHITAYTAKNSFDYFIHKDLGGFLRRELDFYLKSEVISIDNLELNDDPTVFIRDLAQIKTIKRVGNKIIDFLAQLEDFQKQLWLKKKFVLETQYCVTLDKVPESLYPAIIKNKAQRDEWVKLFAIDEIKGDIIATAYSKPLTPEFLKENTHLVLDTRHFNKVFVETLLAALSDAGPIDEQMNGLLVHGENFQALNLLQERYREQVKCIYIDPPYNTDKDDFLYKDQYRISSWLSMIVAPTSLVKQFFLSDKGTFWSNLDDGQIAHYRLILDSIFGAENFVGNIAWKKTSGDNKPSFAFVHDNLIIYGNEPDRALISDKVKAQYANPDNDPRGDWSTPDYRSKWNKEERPNLYYGIKQPHTGEIIFPDTHSNSERVWGCSEETHQKNENNNLIWWGIDKKSTEPHKKKFLSEHRGLNIRSIWDDAGTNDSASVQLKSMFGIEVNGRLNPKPWQLVRKSCTYTMSKDAIVLDYFAGSGTTAHAVINLNREDGGQRRFILIEISNHFETVLLPRIKKVIYAKDWKDGKPKDRNGISQLFKYIRLESYEDTLDSLTVQPSHDLLADAENKQIAEDYQLRYALGKETESSASLLGQDFTDPFNYTLSVVRDGIRRDVKVDLIETFNYLLGLRLASHRQIEGVLTITGINAKGENCLILWRNLKKTNASKLEKWFSKHHSTFGNDLNLIYVNGDHTLNALRKSGDHWDAITTEPVFRELMFSGTE